MNGEIRHRELLSVEGAPPKVCEACRRPRPTETQLRAIKAWSGAEEFCLVCRDDCQMVCGVDEDG